MVNKIETLKNRSGDLVYPISQTVFSNTISTNSFADGAVAGTKLPDQIPVIKMAEHGVDTANIADGAVTADKIVANSIGTADIADGAITNAKIANSTFATSDFADNAVTSAKMARNNDAVTFTFQRENSTSQNVTGRRISLGGNLYMYLFHGNVSNVQAASGSWTHFFAKFPAFTSVYAYYLHCSVTGQADTTTGYVNLDNTGQLQFYVIAGGAGAINPEVIVIGTL